MNVNTKNKWICILFSCFLAAGFLLCIFLPKQEYSLQERRRLASMPAFSRDQVWSGRFMSDFESYAADTFPFRSSLRTLKALTAFGVFGRQDNNGIYFSEGHLAALEYPMDDSSLDRAVQRFRRICETYLTEENNVYLSVIPDKNCFLAEESGHPSISYEEFEEQMAQKAEFVKYITISDLLERDDYYRTDTHWRQERIVDVAQRLAEKMGASLNQEHQVHTLESDFYGVYYGQAALPAEPDRLRYLTGKTIDSCQAYDWQNQREIPVYNLEAASGRDPYELFLSGSLSLITLDNPGANTDRRLVIFRDSFGSSIAPLLLEGYSQIVLVDIRYIHPDLLGRYVDFAGCDVLFLYSTLVLNHSESLQ